jgi:hypothetical protein
MKSINFILGVFLIGLINVIFLFTDIIKSLVGDSLNSISGYLAFGLFLSLPGISIYFLYRRRNFFFALGSLVIALLTVVYIILIASNPIPSF